MIRHLGVSCCFRGYPRSINYPLAFPYTKSGQPQRRHAHLPLVEHWVFVLFSWFGGEQGHMPTQSLARVFEISRLLALRLQLKRPDQKGQQKGPTAPPVCVTNPIRLGLQTGFHGLPRAPISSFQPPIRGPPIPRGSKSEAEQTPLKRLPETSPELAPLFAFFAFWGFPLFSTNQAMGS